MTEMTQPVFILAPPRSFTSVVCGMIGQHPELYGLPEVNLFAGDTYEHLSRWYRVRPRFQHGLLRAVAELGLGGQTEENINTAMDWLEEYPQAGTAEIYYDLAEWATPKALVDKSPMYVYDEDALWRINAAFPEARYIHLLRHPRSTCESMLGLRHQIKEMGGTPGQSTLDPDSIWLHPHVHILDFLETIPINYQLRLRGEDLLTDPDLYLPQIAEWLRLGTDPAAIEAMKHPENSPFACLGPANASFGNDPGFMDSPALRKYHAKPMSLEGTMSWDSTLEFSDELKHYAKMFGYEDSIAL